MVTRHQRTLVTYYVFSDAILAMVAFVGAYLVRFRIDLIPVTKGLPPLEQALSILPFVGILVPVAYYFQGLYSLRRNRSRVDDFFAVFVGSIVGVVLGVLTTLYFQAYYVPAALKDRGAFEVSRVVWGLFLLLNVSLTFLSREAVRRTLERRWRAGVGLKRILVVGAGELGRLVADKILNTVIWGTSWSASSTIAPSGITSAIAGCRWSGRRPRRARFASGSASTRSTSRCRSNSTSGCWP